MATPFTLSVIRTLMRRTRTFRPSSSRQARSRLERSRLAGGRWLRRDPTSDLRREYGSTIHGGLVSSIDGRHRPVIRVGSPLSLDLTSPLDNNPTYQKPSSSLDCYASCIPQRSQTTLSHCSSQPPGAPSSTHGGYYSSRRHQASL